MRVKPHRNLGRENERISSRSVLWFAQGKERLMVILCVHLIPEKGKKEGGDRRGIPPTTACIGLMGANKKKKKDGSLKPTLLSSA